MGCFEVLPTTRKTSGSTFPVLHLSSAHSAPAGFFFPLKAPFPFGFVFLSPLCVFGLVPFSRHCLFYIIAFITHSLLSCVLFPHPMLLFLLNEMFEPPPYACLMFITCSVFCCSCFVHSRWWPWRSEARRSGSRTAARYKLYQLIVDSRLANAVRVTHAAFWTYLSLRFHAGFRCGLIETLAF